MQDEIRLHDLVEMRKKHPCGSAIWSVTRIGADIKMKCAGCGRVVMLDRVEFLRRRKRLITQGPDSPEVTLGLALNATAFGETPTLAAPKGNRHTMEESIHDRPD